MTDRLGELNAVKAQPKSFVSDIESGHDESTEKELSNFNKEAEAIEKVFTWANKYIQNVNSSLSDPDALPNIGAQLDNIEEKLDNVRKRLQRISSENKELSKTQHTSPASLRIRAARCTKLANDLMNTISKLQNVRETHKSVATNAVKEDILKTNPNVSESQVQRALEDNDPAQLDAIMQTDNPHLRYQLEDLQSRNRGIQDLSKSIVQLHQMFTDMSILVDGQQELINDIEHNVEQVKAETKSATGELEVALQHQRSARKKKMCICIIVTVIIVVIVGGILIYLGVNNGWFSSGSSSTSTPSPDTSTPTPDNSTDSSDNTTTMSRFVSHHAEALGEARARVVSVQHLN